MDEMTAGRLYGDPNRRSDNEIAVQHVGQWALVWRRFRRHRLAMIGAWISLAMLALAFVGPYFAVPFVQLNPKTMLLPLWAVHLENTPPQWNWPYIMGADPSGNPMVNYVLLGGRSLLIVSIGGAILASTIGVVLGGLSGYLGGTVDAVIMRLVDVFLAIPFLLLMVLLSRYAPSLGPFTFVVLFGLGGWPGVARLVRGYMLTLREREFAEAARALGASSWSILIRDLLPNALDVIVVSLTLNVAVFLVTAVTLNFLGVGIDAYTWGTTLRTMTALGGPWWQTAFPVLAIALTVLSVNILGDGLRDAFDTTSPTSLLTQKTRRSGPFQRARTTAQGWLVPLLRRPDVRAGVGVATLLVAPAIWAGTSFDNRGMFPVAGPPPAGSRLHRFVSPQVQADPDLMRFLRRHRGNARYLAATLYWSLAASIIAETGEPIMPLGGFAGSDRILDPQGLTALVGRGTVRMFLVFPFLSGGINDDLDAWVTHHCRAVSTKAWQTSPPRPMLPTGNAIPPAPVPDLYDCLPASPRRKA